MTASFEVNSISLALFQCVTQASASTLCNNLYKPIHCIAISCIYSFLQVCRRFTNRPSLTKEQHNVGGSIYQSHRKTNTQHAFCIFLVVF
uniref:Putative secreted protein n=1 Tax=Anopheles triannulatus TaxID=58253 RepID=A0A2M4B1L4_9DIPT